MEHEDELEIFRRDIEAGGYSVAAIVADETGCDWAYSIGLHHTMGHPELFLVGLGAPLAGAIIEMVADEVVAGRRIDPGTSLVLEGGLELRAHAVDALWCGLGDWFNLGREVVSAWGERWPASIQLTWSDVDGTFPERPGDPNWTLRQPLLCAG